MTKKLPWFAARLLFEARLEGEEESALYEERIVLLQAESGMKAAERKAKKLAKAASDEYTNESGASVSWCFMEVLDIVQLNESSLGDGSEVYHHYLSPEEVGNMRQSLKSGSL